MSLKEKCEDDFVFQRNGDLGEVKKYFLSRSLLELGIPCSKLSS